MIDSRTAAIVVVSPTAMSTAVVTAGVTLVSRATAPYGKLRCVLLSNMQCIFVTFAMPFANPVMTLVCA